MTSEVTEPAPVQLVCWKVWGGNSRTSVPVSIPGLRGTLHAEPHDSEAGGDLYYFSACGSGAVGRLCLADVTGHGSGVAKFSAWLEQVFSAQIHRENPAAVLRMVNRLVTRGRLGLMSTAICLSYNSLNGQLRFANAGHPHIRLLRQGGKRWEPVTAEVPNDRQLWNLPLGIESEVGYHPGRIALLPGDRLLVHTDGLTEARNADGALLGKEIWEQPELVRAESGVEEQAQAIRDAVDGHTGGGAPDDDVTFAVLEVLPFQTSNRYVLLWRNNWRKIFRWRTSP